MVLQTFGPDTARSVGLSLAINDKWFFAIKKYRRYERYCAIAVIPECTNGVFTKIIVHGLVRFFSFSTFRLRFIDLQSQSVRNTFCHHEPSANRPGRVVFSFFLSPVSLVRFSMPPPPGPPRSRETDSFQIVRNNNSCIFCAVYKREVSNMVWSCRPRLRWLTDR